METGGIALQIKSTLIEPLKQIETSVQETLKSQTDLRKHLERLMADCQMIAPMLEQPDLQRGLDRCNAVKKRISNLQKRVAQCQIKIEGIIKR